MGAWGYSGMWLRNAGGHGSTRGSSTAGFGIGMYYVTKKETAVWITIHFV
jgi:type V secretory pathway adhesin AidA